MEVRQVVHWLVCWMLHEGGSLVEGAELGASPVAAVQSVRSDNREK